MVAVELDKYLLNISVVYLLIVELGNNLSYRLLHEYKVFME